MGAAKTLYRGCLLGMAVGDAMGHTVDSRTWPEIQEAYGPNGLLGYDLMNGYAEITSYTQLAAFTCNSLLIAITRGQLQGKMAPFVRYIAHAMKEWAAGQKPWGRPERTLCWLLQQPDMCRRYCMDTWMLDRLGRGNLGTPEEPANNYTNPSAITTAIGVGIFFDPDRMNQPEIDRLGIEAVALTHGSPQAFLSGGVLAHIISRCGRQRDLPLDELYRQAIQTLEAEFGHEYSQVYEITSLIRQAMIFAEDETLMHYEVMERLKCETASQVLAGAVYATLASRGDFDAAMIAAVNHSGRSSAVGAIVGAILGARLGAEALPDFYLESLECGETLLELADDLHTGCPMEQGNKLFDLEWDYKYLHGGQ